MNTNHKLKKSSSDALNDIQFSDLFDLNEIQHLQDLFSDAHGVASIITDTDGKPITKPSNFCRLCNNIIRKTEKGRANCFKSNAVLGRHNPSGPIVQPCLSGGLWNAGASITVGGKHIGNWIISQVRDEELDEQRMIQYADVIGANREDFRKALNEVPVMSVGQFNKVAKLLFAFANELSEKAYNNWQLKMQIAEREKATELLQKNEERFQLLFNKAPLGYQSLDLDGNLIEVNQHWLDTLGYTREEVIGKWFGDFLSPAYQDGFRERFPIFKAQGKIHSEFEMVHKNGNKLFIAFEGKIGYDLNGEFKQTHCILQDITEQKRAEKALRKNEAIQGKIVANIGDVILIIDQDEINRYKSPNIEKWFGWRPEDVVGESVWKNVHPDDLDSMQKLFSALLREPNATNTTECRYRCKDGSYKWIEFTGINLLHDPDIRGLLGNYHDITERKQADEKLRRVARLYALLSQINQAIVRIPEEDELFRTICQVAIEFGQFRMAWVGLTDEANDRIIPVAHAGQEDGYLDMILISTGDVPTGRGPTGSAFREGKILTSNDIATEPQMLPWRDKALKRGYRSIAAVPFSRKGKPVGTFTLYATEPGFFTTEEQKLLQEIGEDISFALDAMASETGRKCAEEVLRESESQLSETQSVAKIGSWTTNLTNLEVKWSKEIYRIFEIDTASFHSSHQAFLEFVHPEDRAKVDAAFVLSFDSHSVNTIEHRILTPDGKIKFVEEYWKIISDHQGRPIQAVGSCQDITERKRAEDALRESEVKFRSITEQTTDLIALTDANGFIIYASPASRTLFHYAPEEMCGRHFTEFIDETAVPDAIAVFSGMLGSGKGMKGERKMKRKDGSIFIGELNRSNYQCGELNGTLVIIRDISERKQAEQELIEAKERAEESDELKSAFLNNISHEIRTPFNGILGFLSIIQDGDLTSSERDEYIDLINKSAYRLMNTINDIVEISQIQSGQMKLTASETNIKSLTDELFDHFKTDAESQGLEFSINNDLPYSIDCIFTDRIKLKTILSILIGNAMKFTKAGSIEFGIHKKDAYLEFSVKDTGIGITENKQQVIFERFMQADVSNTRQFEGSGLGLSIAIAYVKMLGGKIWVESEEGKGSVFYFTIPYNVEPEEKNVEKNVVSADVEGVETLHATSLLKILIVEDDQSSAKFVTLIVRIFSKEVLMASNGLEAVKACRDNPDIDLVLMDIQMPEMNGYEATRQIRQFNKEVIIIAQTAFGLTGDRGKAMDAGCNDYISKPIKKDELLSVIRKHIEL